VIELYKEVDQEVLKEARKMSAECLERLGRSGAAERQMIASSRLGASDASAEQNVAEGEVLVTIGERVSIDRTEFDAAWNEIPPYLRDQQFPEPDGREKFLNELAGSRVFAEAARRKGLDRDPEIQRRKRMIEESLLSQKLFEAEVSGKVTLPESDIDLFYKAHLEHYAEPPSVEVAHLVAAETSVIEAAQAAIVSGSTFPEAVAAFSEDESTRAKEGNLGQLVQARKPLNKTDDYDPMDTYVPGIGKERDFVVAAFAMSEIGEVTGPVQTSRGYHLIQLLAGNPASQKPLEEVRRQVESELRSQREQERRAELVEDLMKTHKVRVFADRLK
jgi:peptidyl-prolyl cis-trans isomerase C